MLGTYTHRAGCIAYAALLANKFSSCMPLWCRDFLFHVPSPCCSSYSQPEVFDHPRCLQLPQANNETKYVPLYDTSKVTFGLGVALRPVGESLLDMARDLVAKGIVAAS